MFKKVSQRVETPSSTNRLTIYSDGNDDYQFVMPEFFEKDCMNYGQLVKIREKGKLVGKVKKIVFGNPKTEDIETTDVENFNGIIRERVGRFVRRTKCYSKKTECLSNALSVFQFHWNFMDTLKENMTPAMIEKQSTKIWTWGNFLHTQLRYVSYDTTEITLIIG